MRFIVVACSFMCTFTGDRLFCHFCKKFPATPLTKVCFWHQKPCPTGEPLPTPCDRPPRHPLSGHGGHHRVCVPRQCERVAGAARELHTDGGTAADPGAEWRRGEGKVRVTPRDGWAEIMLVYTDRAAADLCIERRRGMKTGQSGSLDRASDRWQEAVWRCFVVFLFAFVCDQFLTCCIMWTQSAAICFLCGFLSTFQHKIIFKSLALSLKVSC